MANLLDKLGAERATNPFNHGLLFAVVAVAQLDLNQFVAAQGPVDFLFHAGAEAGGTDEHQRIQVVGQGLEVFYLVFVQHGNFFKIEQLIWKKYMARSKSSHRWLKEHFKDPFVQRAQQEGYRSRAAYKLQEIQQRDRIIRPGMRIAELGAAPGGWTQYLSQCLQGRGTLIALDILPMDGLADVHFIQGDFTDDAVLAQLEEALQGQALDLVLSDMAPNTSGIKAADQARSMYLVELALDFALQHLAPGGAFLTKIFQGPGFDTLIKTLRQHFSKVLTRKPEASRARSQETYLLAQGFKGNPKS